MNVDDPAAFRDRFGPALADGPARVDQILSAPDQSRPLLAIVGADGTMWWATYDVDTGTAWITATRLPGRPVETVTGAGCGPHGFRLAFPHRWQVHELLALAHHPMTVVRGAAADFAAVDPLTDG